MDCYFIILFIINITEHSTLTGEWIRQTLKTLFCLFLSSFIAHFEVVGHKLQTVLLRV